MDGKLSQVLQIEPSRELVFHGPFTDVVNAQLTLRNPTERSVCFKVKTTAPKQYCVRPNSGIIPAGGTKSVTVMLQPLDGIPADVARHKFMVQSCYAPNGGEIDLDAIWKSVGQNDLMFSKLTVVFDQTRNSTGAEETAASVTYGSPSGSVSTRVSDASATRGSWEDKYRSESAAKKKVDEMNSNLQKEVNDLFKKNTKLQQDLQGHTEVGIPMIQVVLIAIAGLLIGLIIGKLF